MENVLILSSFLSRTSDSNHGHLADITTDVTFTLNILNSGLKKLLISLQTLSKLELA